MAGARRAIGICTGAAYKGAGEADERAGRRRRGSREKGTIVVDGGYCTTGAPQKRKGKRDKAKDYKSQGKAN